MPTICSLAKTGIKLSIRIKVVVGQTFYTTLSNQCTYLEIKFRTEREIKHFKTSSIKRKKVLHRCHLLPAFDVRKYVGKVCGRPSYILLNKFVQLINDSILLLSYSSNSLFGFCFCFLSSRFVSVFSEKLCTNCVQIKILQIGKLIHTYFFILSQPTIV